MLSHANVSRAWACFEHSNFFKVTAPEARPVQLRTGAHRRQKGREGRCTPWGGPAGPAQGPTTSFLTAATLIYAIGAGITAAAGTRLALQWILAKGFRLCSFQLPDSRSPVLLFIVTTSPCQDWVICAPAAFLGCGSRFSGSLSGIEP